MKKYRYEIRRNGKRVVTKTMMGKSLGNAVFTLVRQYPDGQWLSMDSSEGPMRFSPCAGEEWIF